MGSAGAGLQLMVWLLAPLISTAATVLLAVFAKLLRFEGGIVLSRADAPSLHEAVDDAARVSGGPAPHEIRLYADASVAVHEGGSLPAVLIGEAHPAASGRLRHGSRRRAVAPRPRIGEARPGFIAEPGQNGRVISLLTRAKRSDSRCP